METDITLTKNSNNGNTKPEVLRVASSDVNRTVLFDVYNLCIMILKLLRALFTSTIEQYKIPLQGSIDVKRLKDSIACSLQMQRAGKPTHTSIGYVRKSDLNVDGNVQLVEDPRYLDIEGEEKIVMCAVLLGNVGRHLSSVDVDSARSAVVNGGFVVRHPKQVFPLMEFAAKHKNKTDQQAELRKHVLHTLNGFFGALSPMTDEDQSKTTPPSPQPDRVQIWDVACDRTDVRCANHFGNRRFAAIVCVFMAKNYDLLTVAVRRKVARAIIHIIKSGNPSGRFLGKTKRNTWKELGDELAIRWVASILKSAADNAVEAKRKKDAIDGLAALRVA